MNLHYTNSYNKEISYLGYEIQKAEGIVYPGKSILDQIVKMKVKLKIVMEEFKTKEPFNYSVSLPVDFYKHYCIWKTNK